jgi:uncharacterized protein (DUF952 family)
MNRLLFHITSPQEWQKAQAEGMYRPESLEREGFIHFSTAFQIQGVHQRLYNARRDVLVLVVDETRLTSPLRWESVPGTEMRFPHLYGPLNLEAVVRVIDLSASDLEKELRNLIRPSSRFWQDAFGKFSFALGVLAMLPGGIVMTHTLISSIHHPEANPLMPVAYSILTMFSALLSLVGGALGLAALLQDERKGFASAGCLLNAILFLLLCMLAAMALVAGSAQ